MATNGNGTSSNKLIPAFYVLIALGTLLVLLEIVRTAFLQVTGHDDPTLVALVNSVIPVLTTAFIGVIGLIMRELFNNNGRK